MRMNKGNYLYVNIILHLGSSGSLPLLHLKWLIDGGRSSWRCERDSAAVNLRYLLNDYPKHLPASLLCR